jgi:hypothetical protein
MTTSITYEDLPVADAPWLTFCQTPVYSFAKMGEVAFNASGFRRSGFSTGEGFDIQKWAEYPATLNMTMNNYLEYVGVPLWTTMRDCTVMDAAGKAEHLGLRGNCPWPDGGCCFLVLHYHP